jgi:hypothetical protein
MAEIIHLHKKKTIEETKEELNIIMKELGVDNETLENNFVLFAATDYNNKYLISHTEVLNKVIQMLENSVNLLELIQHQETKENLLLILDKIKGKV